jgi:hypothetical protein
VEELVTTEKTKAKVHLSKRKSVRVETTLPIRFTDLSGGYRHGKTKNISIGGLFVCCSNVVMPIGSFTSLCIDLPNDPPILVYGKVVWTNRYGFGVKFISLDVKDKSKIRTIIRRAAIAA